MTRAFLYILGSSSDPDNVECVVPYQIDDMLIFFGPCKKRLRERLRSEFLLSSDDVVPHEDLWIIGANGRNREQIRKLVWVGQITRIMTFEVAYTIPIPVLGKLAEAIIVKMNEHEGELILANLKAMMEI